MSDLATRLRAELVAALRDDGALRSRRWIDAFTAVPRHEFLRRFFALDDEGAGYIPVGDVDGARWLRLVYTDEAWTTRLSEDPTAWDRARAGEELTGTPTSSSSAPSLMAGMLEALDVTDDSRVLELGTGTGYNAALLSEGLSDARVTSADVDRELVRQAGYALRRLGHRPRLGVFDGDAMPLDHGERFDRLIVTYGVPAVPRRWLPWLEPGGVIVAPIHRDHPIGAVVRLTVTGEGTAEGRFLPFYGAFMPSRHSAREGDLTVAMEAYERGEGSSGTTRLPETSPWGAAEPWLFLVALLLGDVEAVGVLPEGVDDPARMRHWLLAPDGSWARRENDSIVQGGPRRLWTEAEAGYDAWRRLGEPERDRFGLTVVPKRRFLWLDSPTSGVRWDLPT